MILCESGPEGGPALFAGALDHVVADDASAVAPALARLDQLRAQGLWIAGY
ncbi:MAG: aminodeoxychorismate synthase component I, partial [Alphaproteobacteria bacterium]|nr:aminodeoxychorismate synthase component I [Alphaproteobacteria bacterium]